MNTLIDTIMPNTYYVLCVNIRISPFIKGQYKLKWFLFKTSKNIFLLAGICTHRHNIKH